MSQEPEETPAPRRGPAPGEFYEGWGLRGLTAATLFAATMVAAAMALTWLPMALAMAAAGGAEGAPPVNRTQFLIAYAILILAPLGGWLLWRGHRNFAALATVALLGLTLYALAPG